MFYSQFILAKKGPLGTIWIAAHLERKLRKNQVADTDIGVSVDSILFPDVPIALRLSSHLLLGVVRIYSRKVNYLFDDCSEALLKIKQAFRSTAVDLPPEESTAPYHSITLPETFDLDDFELPDNDIFQGNFVDHHVSSRDQITLQDTMEGVVYSTSQFGLDERFGDGDTSGLDLDEELFLKKVEAVENNGAIMNSDADPESSARPMTYHKDDENYEIVENSEMMAASSNLNQIEDFGEDADVIEYAQAPCTPGLLEEPNLPNIQETSACDDHLESYNHNLTEFALKENLENTYSKSGLYLGNRNEIDGSLISDVNPNPLLSKENGPLSDVNPNPVLSKENGSLANDTESNQTNQLEEPAPTTVTISSSFGDQVKGKTMAPHPSDKNLAASDVLDRVEDMQNGVHNETGGHSDDKSSEACLEFQESRLGESKQPALDESLVQNHTAQLSNDMTSEGNLLKSVPYGDASEPHVESHHNIPDLENPGNQDIGETSNNLMIMNPSVHENGVCILLNPGGDTSLDANLQSEVPGTCSVETSEREEGPCALKSSTAAQDEGYHGTDSSKQVENQIAVESQLGNLDGYVGSDLPAPEKLLSIPEVDLENNLFVTDTPYQSKDQTDGDVDATMSVSGKKRSYTESALTMQSLTSIQSSGTVRRKTTPESVPDDDDLLSSILVGRKSSALKVKDTPLPDMSLKRHRSAPRTSTNKRKVLVDETMVLHGDMIRQQLTNTEDIRRVRKKAPCTRPEILMIQKQFLEDEIFSETIFTGVSMDFASLHNQTYDLSAAIITTKDENNVSSGVSREPRSLEEEFSAFLEASNRTNVPVEPHFMAESGTAGNSDHMEVTENDEAQAVEIPVTGSGPEEHTISLDPTNDVAKGKSSQELLGERTGMQMDRKSISDVDVVNPDVTVDAVNTVDMPAVIAQLGSSDKTSDPDALQIYALALIDQQLPVETDADAYTEKKDDMDGAEHAFRITDEVLSREMEDGASVEVGADIQTGGLSTMFTPEMGECNTQTVTVDHAMEDVGQTVIGEDSLLETEVYYNAKKLVIDGFCGEERIIDSSHPEEANADFDNVFVNDGQKPFNVASQLNAMDMGVFPSAQVDRDDFDYSAAGHDTEFLNYDDDDEEAEADDEGAPSAAETRFIENSGWSSRTRAVAKYLQAVFDKEPECKKIIPIDNLLVGKSRKEASRMFFEALVLKTKDYIHVEQTSPFSNINILPRAKLIKSDL